MRLDKALSGSGEGTRSELKKIIRSGKVSVNGKVVTDPGFKVELSDDISVYGNEVAVKENLYFILDKPDGVLTAMEDKRLPTVADYIPENLKGKKLSPVGRLDYHTTGLLIITNDGELSHRLTSPKYKIPKMYDVTYSGDPLTEQHVKQCIDGVILEEEGKKTVLKPSELELKEDGRCILTLYEGKTHEVRRIIASFGRSVLTLRRFRIGDVVLNENEPGTLRPLTHEELVSLKEQAGLMPDPS
ncbi:MAG: rRNA pseudouridine synthase [Clostridiales bacterium]|nr:rRNA pseudouridine synthase [Clostridiales bacterium]